MSFNKARERQQQAPDVVSDHGLLCRVPGCGRLWSVDISHGRVCSMHDDAFSRAHAPRLATPAPRRLGMPTLREAVKPFCEPERDDE
jgi:hypothetical protein